MPSTRPLKSTDQGNEVKERNRGPRVLKTVDAQEALRAMANETNVQEKDEDERTEAKKKSKKKQAAAPLLTRSDSVLRTAATASNSTTAYTTSMKTSNERENASPSLIDLDRAAATDPPSTHARARAPLIGQLSSSLDDFIQGLATIKESFQRRLATQEPTPPPAPLQPPAQSHPPQTSRTCIVCCAPPLGLTVEDFLAVHCCFHHPHEHEDAALYALCQWELVDFANMTFEQFKKQCERFGVPGRPKEWGMTKDEIALERRREKKKRRVEAVERMLEGGGTRCEKSWEIPSGVEFIELAAECLKDGFGEQEALIAELMESM